MDFLQENCVDERSKGEIIIMSDKQLITTFFCNCSRLSQLAKLKEKTDPQRRQQIQNEMVARLNAAAAAP